MEEDYDAIVIGAGMAGGAFAFRMTQLGYRVLLIEKGPDKASAAEYTPEEPDPQKRLLQGSWPGEWHYRLDGLDYTMWPYLGCGVGGSTTLYGAALERFDPYDFEERRLPNGDIIGWPISYDELEPYYLLAEAQLRVRGTPDPLDSKSEYHLLPPPPVGRSDTELISHFRSRGLHPYRLHVGIDYSHPDCDECGGRACRFDCKRDARNSFVIPSIQTGRLEVLTDSEVIRLVASKSKVEHVVVRCGNEEFCKRAKIFALAAGAVATPRLLLSSTSSHWPSGVGNDIDLVGRFLMFHAADMIAIWSKAKPESDRPSRTIAMRDFYGRDSELFGELQSMGITVEYGDILHAMRVRYQSLPLFPFVSQLLRIPALVASKVLRNASVFSAITQDHPYAKNRVFPPGAGKPLFEYDIPDELQVRVRNFRRMIKQAIKPRFSLILNHNVAMNFGHPCGTCRAGLNPLTSVVDASCRLHRIENLYVADASTFPTSGGTNPSLTIAANALRVADHASSAI